MPFKRNHSCDKQEKNLEGTEFNGTRSDTDHTLIYPFFIMFGLTLPIYRLLLISIAGKNETLVVQKSDTDVRSKGWG